MQSLCRVSKASCCSGPQFILNFFFWLDVPSKVCKSVLRCLATLEKLGINSYNNLQSLKNDLTLVTVVGLGHSVTAFVLSGSVAAPS